VSALCWIDFGFILSPIPFLPSFSYLLPSFSSHLLFLLPSCPSFSSSPLFLQVSIFSLSSFIFHSLHFVLSILISSYLILSRLFLSFPFLFSLPLFHSSSSFPFLFHFSIPLPLFYSSSSFSFLFSLPLFPSSFPFLFSLPLFSYISADKSTAWDVCWVDVYDLAEIIMHRNISNFMKN
jgi:hypothetical protein